ncbi:MAG: ADP-forming succinate--CoA ligase subunit beta [Phycisphaerales bacterium]
MKVHEYQARELLRSFGIPVPAGRMIESIEAAAPAYRESVGADSGLAVVKAQVHAGGRGKAGFVKLVRSAAEATDAARFMLTHRMVSPQTPPEGLEVKRLLVAAGVDIAERKASAPGAQPAREEFYLAITTDRKTRRNVLIASREGGVEIEQVAHDRPDAIIKEPLHPLLGLQAHQARRVAFALGFAGKHANQAAGIMVNLARLYVEKDCTLAEINPLVIAVAPRPAGGAQDSGPRTQDSQVLAIDAKFNFDDNALFRHPDIQAMHDPSEEDPGEQRAQRFGLSYVALDGTIGCLVNGAGLAMATMDIIKLHGGEPANFLDVGGSASEEAVTEAFSIILADARVKGILVNIFGGIMKCDIIAQGIVNAAGKHRNADGSLGFRVPLVVRLEGTNVDAGRKLLNDARARLPTLQAATDLGDAAKKVCAAVG